MLGIKGPFRAVSEGKISEVVYGGFRGQRHWARCLAKGEPSLPPLGVIEVIHAAPMGIAMVGSRGVLTVTPVGNCS